VGDAQFAVLCEEIEGEEASIGIAQRLEAALAFPFELEQVSVHLSASVGIALAGGQDADAEALIRGAAKAMRNARALGGNRYEVFHQPPNAAD
jgi:GGDEF domain-containing protein